MCNQKIQYHNILPFLYKLDSFLAAIIKSVFFELRPEKPERSENQKNYAENYLIGKNGAVRM